MTTLERIQQDLVGAMKSKDELRLSVLRMVKSALKNKEIEKIRPLDEAEAMQVLQTLLKQRRESVEMFTKGRPHRSGAARNKRNRRPRIVLARFGRCRGNGSRDRIRHRRNQREFGEANGCRDQSR